MSSTRPSYLEASVPVGVGLIAIGVGLWAADLAVGVFTSWIWALAVGGLWVLVGVLFLFGDIRLYQFDRSPVERLLIDHDLETE